MSAPVIRPYLVGIDDMGSLASALPSAYGMSWRAEINEVGYGTISLKHSDPMIDGIVLSKSLVHFMVDDALAFTMILERAVSIDVDRGEYGYTNYTGPGVGALFNRMLVDPSGGPDRLPTQEDRTFDFSAFEFDDSAWDNATEICTVGDAQVEWPAGTTVGPTLWDPDFADPAAAVLWTAEGTTALADVGDRYSREVFNVAADGQYQLQVLCDNVGELSFDNQMILTPGQADDANYSGWTRAATQVLELTAGDHIVAMKTTNLGGPAGFAWTLCPQDENGVLGGPVASSSTAATIIAATSPPGMTVGEDLVILYNEQTTRAGADPLAAANVTDFSFDPVDDSNSNPWDDTPTISTKVGTTEGSFLREISATYADFKVGVDLGSGLAILDAYRKGEMGGTPGVTYSTANRTLVAMRRTSEGPAGNSLLGHWGGGWTERNRQSSIDTYGRWEALLYLGANNDIAEARRVMDGQLDEFAILRTQTDISIEPSGSGDVPWLDYAPEGATITVQGEAHRILAVTCAVDDETGHAHFALTLNDSVVLSPEERMAQILTKLTPGSLGGRSKVATQPIPRYLPRGRGASESMAAYFETFNKADGAGWGPVLTWAGPGGPYNTETRSNAGTGADGEGVLGVPDADTITSDMYVECTIADLEAPLDDAGWGVNLRGRLANRTSYTSGSTHYMLEIAYSVADVSVRFQLRRHTALNAGGTIIATALTTLAEGDVVRLEVEGTAIRGKKNGTTIVSVTDATYTTGTGAGLDVANFPIFPGVDPRHAVSVDTFRFGDL